MRADELRPSPPVARAGGQLREGLAYTWAHPDLVLAMALAFVIGTFGFNYQVTIALMAREQFDLGAEAFGLLSTFFAVGSLSGALLSTRRSVRPRQRFLVVSAVVFGLFTVAAGLMPGYVSFAVLLVPTGAAALVFSVANNSFVQLGVDPQMRGRVMALYFMCFMGGTPVGAPLIGLISEHLGARWGLIMGGAVCVVAGIAAAAVLARGRRVRLEAGLAPPRLRLRVGARGQQVLRRLSRDPGRRIPEYRLVIPSRGRGGDMVGSILQIAAMTAAARGRVRWHRPAAPLDRPAASTAHAAPGSRRPCGVRSRWSPPTSGGSPVSCPSCPPGAPMARRRALAAAFDDVLIEAAALLEVPHVLRTTPDGPARDLERLRLLADLEAAGLAVHG